MMLRNAPPSRTQKGFTLIEVLVAFVILAGSVLALMQLFSGGLNAAQRLDESSKAATYAESRMAETLAQKELGEGSESGEYESGRFRWTATVTVQPDPVPPPEGQQPQNMRIKLVEVTVQIDFGFAGEGAESRSRNVTLRTLRVIPKKVGEA
jgi:general secretion pathway protein I